MKELIKDIKYSRIPIEVFDILNLIENPPKLYKYTLPYIHIRTNNDMCTLFEINENNKTINCFNRNIFLNIIKIHSISYNHNFMCECIETAISMSKYSDYKIK